MHPRKNDMQIANEQNKTFIEWLKERVSRDNNASEMTGGTSSEIESIVVCIS